jgi:hypothetical protein
MAHPYPKGSHKHVYIYAGTYYGWDCNLKPKFEGNNKDTVVFLSLEEYQKFTFVSRGRDGKLSLDSSGFGRELWI